MKDKNRFNVATLIYKVPDHRTMTMVAIVDHGNLARVLSCSAIMQAQELGNMFTDIFMASLPNWSP